MAKKAKIVMVNETYVIAEMSVADAQAALGAGGLVSIPVSNLEYNKELTTINIGDKTQPAYTAVTAEKVIDSTRVLRVEECPVDEAAVHTGTAELPEEETSEGEDATVEGDGDSVTEETEEN